MSRVLEQHLELDKSYHYSSHPNNRGYYYRPGTSFHPLELPTARCGYYRPPNLQTIQPFPHLRYFKLLHSVHRECTLRYRTIHRLILPCILDDCNSDWLSKHE